MSKRDLKKYLNGLEKEQIIEQFTALYDKFPEVKTYYNFVFRPNEEKLAGEARAKIRNEYFPVKSRRAKLRRSTAQHFIKHFMTLGVDPFLVADVMLFNIETAMAYTAKRPAMFGAFYKSMLKSYEQAVSYMVSGGIWDAMAARAEAIPREARKQHWENASAFDDVLARLAPGQRVW